MFSSNGGMTDFMRDLRQGFRLLFRAPGFAATAILTLALGIGATTALFTVVNAVLIEPLPFPDSNRLVQVWRSELPALTYGSASYPRYLDWRRQQRVFTDLGAWSPRGMTLSGPEGPERLAGAMASASFFSVVGAPPVAGRYFSEAEDRRGGEKVAVISEALWRRRFAGSPSAVGSSAQIDGEPYTIVGVAPSGFTEIWRLDVWIPVGQVADPSNRFSNFLLSFGKLREGMTLDAARSGMADLAAQMSRENAADKYTFTVRPVHEVITENATRGLWMLLAATGLLLLIACTNVANLLLARSVVRERDLAVRASLGAGRGRLFGQVMGETIALGVVGSVVGIALTWGLLRIFVTLAPVNFPRLAAIDLDWSVLGFALIVAVFAGVVAGIAPAIHLLRSDLNAVIRSGGNRAMTAGRARAASRLLVISEVALALALVTTAGLMVKSLLRLQSQDLGLTREPVLTFGIGVPPFVASGNDAVARFQLEFLQRIRALPGVTHVSAISLLPIGATGNNGPVRRVDQLGDNEGVPVTEFRIVMDRYFETMEIPMVAGRSLDDRDRKATGFVAVVNETLAQRLFPNLKPADVVGQPIRLFGNNGPTNQIVGIAANIRSRRPEMPPDPEVYVPFEQNPTPGLSYVVRAQGNPAALTGQIRTQLSQMTPFIAMANPRTFEEVVANATRQSGLLSWLSVLFGVLAAALAILGIYSVMSYTVAQRERELAIRAAVGANRSSLLSMVLREGLLLSGAGIAAGAALALGTSRVLGSLLYQVSATDPMVFIISALGLATIALAGYLIPAARASRVEPVVALRSE
ncbi:MAG TPA: ABC transporter permease [Vicinamibacterales bacterium]|nr:ABC transporter permease [Vicinamibacterales bacterium]